MPSIYMKQKTHKKVLEIQNIIYPCKGFPCMLNCNLLIQILNALHMNMYHEFMITKWTYWCHIGVLTCSQASIMNFSCDSGWHCTSLSFSSYESTNSSISESYKGVHVICLYVPMYTFCSPKRILLISNYSRQWRLQ